MIKTLRWGMYVRVRSVKTRRLVFWTSCFALFLLLLLFFFKVWIYMIDPSHNGHYWTRRAALKWVKRINGCDRCCCLLKWLLCCSLKRKMGVFRTFRSCTEEESFFWMWSNRQETAESRGLVTLFLSQRLAGQFVGDLFLFFMSSLV